MMKKVWLAQPTKMKNKSIFLPYSIGTIAAYTWQFEEIKNHYALQEFIFFMDEIEAQLEKLDNPYLMAFSSYMWNINYNLSLAKAVKEKYPDCLIVFGGPDVPENATFLEKYPFIDFLIFREGEVPFYQLLNALRTDGDCSKITNLAYRSNGENCVNPLGIQEYIWDYPSPYLEGYFDSIIYNPEYKDFQFDVVFETNRGCPYNCLYCSWGAKNTKLRQFDIARVHGDIEWIVKHKINYCMCTDGNFGIFDRDKEIADYLIALKKKSGYPQMAEIIAAKSKDDTVFEINKKLNAVGLNRGVSIACQTLTPHVLKIVNRVNMSVEKFSAEVKKYREAGIFTYTDMILGLPGESYDSFCESVFNVYEAGQDSLMIYMCELLPCSPMAHPEIVKKYNIKTINSYLCQFHTSIFEKSENNARSAVVVQTSTMSQDDWLKMMFISVYAQAFHGFGITRYYANYLRRAQGITYYDFYIGLFDYIRNENAFTRSIVQHTMASLQGFLNGEGPICFYDHRFGDIYYDLNEAVFACVAAEKDAFYEQIEKHLKPLFEDEALYKDLKRYQMSKISFPYTKEHTEVFNYDWEAFFSDMYNTTPKKPDKKTVQIAFFSAFYDDLELYCRDVLWIGKRIGKTYVKSQELPPTTQKETTENV